MGADPLLRRLRLRPATPADVALLRRWDAMPHVQAATAGADWQWETVLERTPPWRVSLIAELDGRPVGFLEIIDPHEDPDHYWGEVAPNQRALDIWIGEPDLLGQGIGTAMMRAAIERCFADPAVTGILLDPLVTNSDAHRFYERLGFRCIERRRFDGDDCFVYRLDRPG